MDEKEKKKFSRKEAVIPTAAIVPVRDIAAVSREVCWRRPTVSMISRKS